MADSSSSSSSSSTAADCRVGIELTRTTSLYDVPGATAAWRMAVVVSRYWNVDPNIFLYKRLDPNPGSDEYRDTFQGIVSPVDIDQYPVGAPADGDNSKLFRLSSIDLLFRSRELMDETWTYILSDRDKLIDTLTSVCEFTEDIVDAGGEFPEDEEEESSEDSSSSSSSDESETCPLDNYTTIKITSSSDPDFPVDATFSETSSEPYPLCTRTWELNAAVTPDLTLRLETSMITYSFICSTLEGENTTIVDAGGISAEYKTFITYRKDDGSDVILHIEGVV